MKKIKQAAVWLLVAELCFWLLPELSMAVIFYVQKHSLAQWIPWLCTAGSGVIGLICMLTAVLIWTAASKKTFFKTAGRFWAGFFPILLVYLCLSRGLSPFVGLLTRLFHGNAVPVLLFEILFILALSSLQAVLLYSWFSGCRLLQTAPSAKALLKKPLKLICLAAFTLLANMLPELVFLAVEYFPVEITVYIASGFILCLFVAAARTLIWLPRLKLIQSVCDQVSAEVPAAAVPINDTSEKTAPPTPRLLFPLISAIAAALILIFGMIRDSHVDPISLISGEISNRWAQSSVSLMVEDFEGALQEMEEAALIRDAWLSAAGSDSAPDLQQLLIRHPNSTLLHYLIGCSRTDRLEDYLRTNDMNPEFALALLDLYAQDSNLDDKARIYQQELLQFCIQTSTYTVSWLRPSDLEGIQEALEQELYQYQHLSVYTELLEQMISVLKTNKVSQDAAQKCLQLAKENPDEWLIQYLAARYGGEFRYDGARHYDEAIAAAMRFDKLYLQSHELTDEGKRSIKLKTANMILSCFGYKEALTYLEEAADIRADEQTFSLILRCYDELERYDECYEFCNQWLTSDPDHAVARYYAALCALKTDRIDDSIYHTSQLAEQVKNTCTAENSSADVALYSLLQFMTLRDTNYYYSVFSSLTDEQRAEIDKNPFFADYLDSVYYGFYGNREAVSNALTSIERVLAANENLPQAWYLKGAILYAEEKLTDAVNAYRRSLTLAPESPTAWYALANAYDGLEEYDLAYEACQRTLALLPGTDHTSDWYGVAIHCENLMNSIDSMRKEGK